MIHTFPIRYINVPNFDLPRRNENFSRYCGFGYSRSGNSSSYVKCLQILLAISRHFSEIAFSMFGLVASSISWWLLPSAWVTACCSVLSKFTASNLTVKSLTLKCVVIDGKNMYLLPLRSTILKINFTFVPTFSVMGYYI